MSKVAESKVAEGKVAEAVDRYLAAWNERDPSRRRVLIADTWTEEGYYVDPHRRGDGHNGIDAMIQAVQERFPTYRFRLSSVVDAHNDRVRFTWEAGGTENAPMHFVGTDFGVISKDGRFESITGFVDVGPGAPSKL
jgi:SnoaL-like domain